LTPEELLAHARQFVFPLHPDEPNEAVRERDTITIENRSKGQWAVLQHGKLVLARDGEWEWEPLPSERTEAFKRRTRYTLTQAVRLARLIQAGTQLDRRVIAAALKEG
jgi:hypothetical protein